MDVFSAQLSNALLGKNSDKPVIEIHFPASQFLFEKETIFSITGADFSPEVNDKKVQIGQPVAVNKNDVLKFSKSVNGARCYLSVLHDMKLEKWLNSYSTNFKAAAGGWHGRSLQKEDRLEFENEISCKRLLSGKDFYLLPWRANTKNKTGNEIRFVRGNEWAWLNEDCKNIFSRTEFQISKNSDRMGYRMSGEKLKLKENKQLVSSPVTFGTIQLLPDGQLIILMADHQTTGGYPRIGNVISVDNGLLAQKSPGDKIFFAEVENNIAEQELFEQQKYLQQLQTACKFKIENLLNATL
jgi:antagonist of KipI